MIPARVVSVRAVSLIEFTNRSLFNIASTAGGYRTLLVAYDVDHQSKVIQMLWNPDTGRAITSDDRTIRWTSAISAEDAGERFFGINGKTPTDALAA